MARVRNYPIRVRYPGQCALCGEPIPAGGMADYNPEKRVITHEGGIRGVCFDNLNQKANGPKPVESK